MPKKCCEHLRANMCKNESRKEMENGMDPLQLSPQDTERQALYGRTMAIAVAHVLCKINGGKHLCQIQLIGNTIKQGDSISIERVQSQGGLFVPLLPALPLLCWITRTKISWFWMGIVRIFL